MYWDGKMVLLTGGTGSFGREFLRQILRDHTPKAVRVFSRDELKQSELQAQLQDNRVRYLLGDVRDRDRLARALDGVDVCVHAAALKQVPACEYNPIEAVKTNVNGAANIIDAAIDCGVGNVIALSTDKAVNPVNLYGGTKLCAEKLFVQGNSYAGSRRTRFANVRYGNVLGSRGSVITIFRQQARTGVVHITDPRMTRFWITLEQAATFVLRCAERMRGGEVFVPKIPSMRVVDLATAVAPGCRQQVVGIRPGEKLHEVLLTEDEARHTNEMDDHYVIEPEHPWWDAESRAGRRVTEGFKYGSDTNDRWLSTSDLQRLVG